jgi:hypothetical protein
MILNYCHGSRGPYFRTGNNKMELLMEYENVTQKLLLLIQSILHTAKYLQHALLSWHVRCSSGVQLPPSTRILQHLRCNAFDGGEGGYEQPSKYSCVVYITAEKLV